MPAVLTSPVLPDYDGPEGGVLRCVVAYNRHGGYCVPRAAMHRPCAQAILRGDAFEPETIDLLRRLAAGGDVVHAGTFFGDMLPAVARACGPERIVWACEPNGESHRCAGVTVALNGLGNVRLHHAALGASPGTGLLRVADATGRALGGRSSLVGTIDAAAGERGETVLVARVDDLVPADRQVAIVHLDVERHEQEALAGALATIRRCRPAILVETVPETTWIDEHLAPLGYAIAGRVGPNTLLVAG